jgi:hypothetical protein
MPRSKDPNYGRQITWDESFDQIDWYPRTGTIKATGRHTGWYYVLQDAMLFEGEWAFSGLTWIYNDNTRRNVAIVEQAVAV